MSVCLYVCVVVFLVRVVLGLQIGRHTKETAGMGYFAYLSPSLILSLNMSVCASVWMPVSSSLSLCLCLSVYTQRIFDRWHLELVLRDVSVGRGTFESPVLHRQSNHESRQQQYHNE